MKIKKYLVKSIEDAIYQIKRDLGKDAYILSQKKVVKRGKLNLSNVEMIEVTAAVENVKPDKDNISASLLSKKYNYSSQEEQQLEKETIFGKMRPHPKAPDSVPDTFVGGPSRFPEGTQARTRAEFHAQTGNTADIEDQLRPLTKQVAEIKKLLRTTNTGFDGYTEFKGIYFDLYLDLVENGVEKKLAGKLIHTLQYQVDAEQMGNTVTVKKHLFNLITSSLSLPSPLRLEKGKRKVVVMMGPTGSGKTTTLAKLGSYFKLMDGRKVAFMTIDSYRIGAEAHLRTYADILDAPFYSVYNERDLRIRLDKLKDFDVVFVDTTGRSPNDKKGLYIMEKHLTGIPEDEKEVYLVLSASTKSADLHHIYEKYSLFKPDKFIFSKIDESLSLGNIFNLKMKTDIPTAYFTTGQRVPEDIEIAYPRKFARKLFLDYNSTAGEK